MRQNHDHGSGRSDFGYDRWEEMTPAERKYEKEHPVRGDDWWKILIAIMVIYFILQFISSLHG